MMVLKKCLWEGVGRVIRLIKRQRLDGLTFKRGRPSFLGDLLKICPIK